MAEAYSSATGGVYRLISRCAALGVSPIWRVNTSNTQARQIHFSSCLTDSGGSADTSSGPEPIFARAPVLTTATLVSDAVRLDERFSGFSDTLADGFLAVFRAGLALVGILTKAVAIYSFVASV